MNTAECKVQSAKRGSKTGTKAFPPYLWFHLCLCFLLFPFSFFFLSPLLAFDRTNIPLKNWGGSSVHRSWVYDALEKVVLAGLADQAILNTKPISRVEGARIVAQAVRRLESAESGGYYDRASVEELLYRLIGEFGPELTELGVRTPLNRDASASFFGFEPVNGRYQATPEKAFLDVCYFFFKGKRFSFDPAGDINIHDLDFERIEGYLDKYDKRFLTFFNRMWRGP